MSPRRVFTLPGGVMLAYAMLALAFALGLAAMAWGIHGTREAARQNRQRIEDIERIQLSICAGHRRQLAQDERLLASTEPIPFVATDARSQATARILIRQDRVERRRDLRSLMCPPPD